MFNFKKQFEENEDNAQDNFESGFLINLKELNRKKEEKTENLNKEKEFVKTKKISFKKYLQDLKEKKKKKQLMFKINKEKKKLKFKTFLNKKRKNPKKESLWFLIKVLLNIKKEKKKKKSFKLFTRQSKSKVLSENYQKFNKALSTVKADIVKIKSYNKLKNKKKIEKEEEDEIKDLKIVWYRRLFSFLLLLIILIIPFKLLDYWRYIDLSKLESRVLIHSQAAIDNLMLATGQISDFELSEAQINFSQASVEFSSALDEIEGLHNWLLNLASLSSNPRHKLAADSKNIFAAGSAGALLGENFTKSIDVLFNSDETNWLIIIDDFVYYGEKTLDYSNKLKDSLSKINKNILSPSQQMQFNDFLNKLEMIDSSFRLLVNSAFEIKELLGYSHDKRYLLIFQNNTEMRASGGFMGSYALLDFDRGELRNVEVPAGGTYDTEAGMRSFIISPRPLWLVNPRWFFWDANWWPDWPTTARNLMWFYEKSDGPTVDGVISFTPNVLKDLLNITGAISLEKDYGVIIDEDNFLEFIQSTVEKDNLILTHPEYAEMFPDSPENQPKKIIGDLMEKLLEELPNKLNAESLPLLIKSLERNFKEKNILLYFSDEKAQEKIVDLRLDASVRETLHDYLMVVNTNIAGQKTDQKIDEKVFLDSKIMQNGKIINEVTIIRSHQGEKNLPMTGVRNVNWLRVYVPMGSKLISAEGFSRPDIKYFDTPEEDWLIHPILKETEELALIDSESGVHIYQENSKTVFANWLMTDPGESSVVKIRYELPFQFKASQRDRNYLDFINALLAINQERPAVHSLLVQKQPGLKPHEFYSRLRINEGYQVDWRYPDNITKNDDAWFIRDVIDRDKFYAILALPKK